MRPGRVLLVGLAALLAASVVPVSPASPATAAAPAGVGVVDQHDGRWYLRDAAGTTTQLYYGWRGDLPFMGDWDCDGVDTPGVYRPSEQTIYLRNSNTTGVADWWFVFGNPGDLPVAGDFDGDGCDSVALYRSSDQRLYVTPRHVSQGGNLGSAEHSYLIGIPGDRPVAGDFDGDGIDEVALFRPSEGRVYYWMGTPGGFADASWVFGYPPDVLVTGDWMGGGAETLGAFRATAGRFLLTGANGEPAIADTSIEYGGPDMLAVAGRFGSLPGADQPPRIRREAFSLSAVIEPPLSTASGEGCLVPGPGDFVQLVFDNGAGSRLEYSLPVGADGTWSGEFSVSYQTLPGDYRVTASCIRDGEARLVYLPRVWLPNEHWQLSRCGAPVWEGIPQWLGPEIGWWIVGNWGIPASEQNPSSTSVAEAWRQGDWIAAAGPYGMWTRTPQGALIPTFVLRTQEETIAWMRDRPPAEDFLAHIRSVVPALPDELAVCIAASGVWSDLPTGPLGPGNAPPLAVDDHLLVFVGASEVARVLANDWDREGSVLTAPVVVTPPTQGTVVLNADKTITYTHDRGGIALTDSFTYKTGDGVNESNVAIVRVEYACHPLLVVDDAATVEEGGTVLIDVLANDSDPNGFAWVGSAVHPGCVYCVPPAHGTVVANPGGTITYTHGGSQNYRDAFTYAADNGMHCSGIAKVTITAVPTWRVSACGEPVWVLGASGTTTTAVGPTAGLLAGWVDANWPDVVAPVEVNTYQMFRQDDWTVLLAEIMGVTAGGVWIQDPTGDFTEGWVPRSPEWMSDPPTTQDMLGYLTAAAPDLPAELALCAARAFATIP